jgi:biopolymer transport protein ExbD
MAEIIESVKKTGKRSTRVDLTPMVDLGFLLITFFIFTTAMSKPTGLKIYLPQSVPDNLRMNIPESGALTILLAGKGQIYYYEGDDPHLMQIVSNSTLRDIILSKKKRSGPEKFMVIIKPGKDSDFHTLVKVLDEMSISDVKHYAMVDMDPREYSLEHLQ